MNIAITILSLIVSILALVVSCGLLLIHYQGHVERRHSEIIQLQLQIFSTLSTFQQRFTATKINLEMVRLELHQLPDYENEYDSRIAALLDMISSTALKNDEAKTKFEQVRAHEINRTAVLLALQDLAFDTEKMTPSVEKLENETLGLVNDVRMAKEAESSAS